MKGCTMMAAQRETAVIEGTAYWSKLNQKDEYSNKYQMDIGNLSEETKELLKENGVKLKNKDDDRGEFITARSKFTVQVMDSDKKPFDNETLIGNGSIVKARIAFNKTHPMVEKFGTSLYLNKVQITDLVKYGNEDSDFDDELA